MEKLLGVFWLTLTAFPILPEWEKLAIANQSADMAAKTKLAANL